MPSDAYDSVGNLHDHPAFGTMVYDAENRLIEFTNAGNVTQYDGEGRRARKTVTGTLAATTVYVYDAGGALAAEYSTTNTGDGGTSYLTADHLGSTRHGTGKPLHRLDCAPIGEGLSTYSYRGTAATYISTGGPTMKFTGKERDAETGLDYFGARYFSAAQGRFISPDWSATPQPVPYANLGDPQTLNLYSYVRNNPLSNRDANGHCGTSSLCWQIFGWAAGRIAVNGPKQFAKDVGIGVAKGAGSFAVNTVRGAVAMGQGAGGNPVAAVSTMMAPGPKALAPSNETQATVSAATQVTLTAASALAPALAPAAIAPTGAEAAAASSSVSWSGPGAEAAAQTWSAVNNGTMIGTTEFGQAAQSGAMTWKAASESFANSASGTVQVFSNDPFTSYGNIWFNYE
ncbi:MAG TPA: RHS repeat-associated core domain-containing protein, partial [Candidatus Sulfopaludibacter sp.]|nr:RHS repeat-associated core domain-containing protein [Candidatus Sulfopaludibacter sp.]